MRHRKEKPKEIYSVQTIELKDDDGDLYATVRVWRRELAINEFGLSTQDIHDTAAQFHQMAAEKIVTTLFELNGVVKVEWTGRDKCGFVVQITDNI